MDAQDRAGRLQFSSCGEDRNRTCPGSCEPTTVLKTARATRHPSLSGKEKPAKQKRRRPESSWNLFELFDLADDFVEVRPITGIELGVHEFSVGADFKSAAARRD